MGVQNITPADTRMIKGGMKEKKKWKEMQQLWRLTHPPFYTLMEDKSPYSTLSRHASAYARNTKPSAFNESKGR